MANVVDELTVSLGLDASAFKRGLADTRANLKTTAEASTVTAKEMQAQGKRAGEFFSGIKTEALSLLGVLVGSAGLSAFVKDTASSFTALGYAAGNINLPVQELAAFRNMISENGGSADAAQSSLLSLANTMQGLKLGLGAPGQFLAGLNVIGGTYQDTPMAILQKFAQYSENVPKTQSNAIGRMLGLDQDTMNLTQRGVGYFMDHMQQAMQRGVPSKEMVERQTSFYRSLMDVGQAAGFAGQAFLDKYVPGLTAANDALTKWISTNKAQAGSIEATIAALATAPIALWMLRWLGLAAVGETAATLGLLAAPAFIATGGFDPNSTAGRFMTNAGDPALAGGAGGPSGPTDFGHGLPIMSYLSKLNVSGALPPEVEAEVRRQALLHGLDPDHMVRLARREGGIALGPDGKLHENVSSAGAYGTMQLMPENMRAGGITAASPWQDNVRVGMAQYAAELKWAAGNYAAADAAYNAGRGKYGPAVTHFRDTGNMTGLPQETKDYVHALNPSTAFAQPTPGETMHRLLRSANPAPASNTTVSVGTVNVHTQATDAKGISVDIHQAIVDSWVQQANRGLN